MDWIVHICSPKDWEAAQRQKEYRPASLSDVGFIHCSRPEQVLETANRYFPGQTSLVLLWIDVHRLQSELRWEAADGQAFPHLYGPLGIQEVIATSDFSADADGIFRHLPDSPGI
jgi:uncharacterized protein (DUF952 family)